MLDIIDGKLSCVWVSEEAPIPEEVPYICGTISGFTAQSDIISCNRRIGVLQEDRMIWMRKHRPEPYTYRVNPSGEYKQGDRHQTG